MNISETARDVWDKIAKEYDRTNTPTQMWVGTKSCDAQVCILA